MSSEEVTEAIEKWGQWATENNGNYDIALFKIWIKFEKYLGDVFYNYAIGNPSENNYYPELKLKFINGEQFSAFMADGNKKYIDYLKKIERLSAHIFVKNPFEVILTDCERKKNFEQMKAIRNYIAHESVESKRKFIDQCFSGREDKFLEPNEFLKTKPKGNSDSYYTIYINTIIDVLKLINVEVDE